MRSDQGLGFRVWGLGSRTLAPLVVKKRMEDGPSKSVRKERAPSFVLIMIMIMITNIAVIFIIITANSSYHHY